MEKAGRSRDVEIAKLKGWKTDEHDEYRENHEYRLKDKEDKDVWLGHWSTNRNDAKETQGHSQKSS